MPKAHRLPEPSDVILRVQLLHISKKGSESPCLGPKVYGLRVPAMAQREQLPPKGRFFLRSQPSWVAKADSIPGKQAE